MYRKSSNICQKVLSFYILIKRHFLMYRTIISRKNVHITIFLEHSRCFSFESLREICFRCYFEDKRYENPRIVSTDENIQKIESSFEKNSDASIRRASQTFDIHRESLRNISTYFLNFHPYTISLHHISHLSFDGNFFFFY